ncbi:vWA domain-containing protein [Paraliomyxa miuraensis]|uniref:vWA domain-containing protein n=1 Tax=Paraliomyxa miuraensis TaxID=376150 RepID=UPI0022552438|nr:vWA domain-containing protein [Paraliomyxa miuraensis]MCX4243403.1 VWA domain-containing protein [Paraliomyxa miuraensis]
MVALGPGCGCAPPIEILGSGSASTSVDGVDLTGPPEGSTSSLDTASTGDTDPVTLPCSDPDTGVCSNRIDLLFVIDNSGTMGEEQLNLAKNFPMLIEQLQTLEDRHGNPVGADVNIMVTTSDFDNPQCHGSWNKPDYVPAKGSPVHTACVDRLERFTGYGDEPLVIEEACLEVCDPIAPAEPTDQFIHFDPDGSNVMGGSPADALACLGPQGIDGCGYEAPLESMLQALNPSACWNDPAGCDDPAWAFIDEPFLRDGALLAIAIITDEADCSVRDFSIMDEPTFMEIDPISGQKLPSSAICWNAGVVCDGLEPDTGVYAGCAATNKGVEGAVGVSDAQAVLHPTGRYKGLLQSLRGQGREVIMLGVLGVPEVTDHAPVPPHQPIAGGLEALVYRQWRDPDVPAGGDILPDEWNDGTRAVRKQFEFGIGPGCTGYDPATDVYTGQAIPPVRIRDVCESLNTPDDPMTSEIDETRIRCCVESICDDDFSPAIRCLTGLIQDAVVPVG